MKKIVILIFFLSCFSLFAQNYRQINLFVPSVIGEGNTGDREYFNKQLAFELIRQRHQIVTGQRLSDYILKGAVVPLKDFLYIGLEDSTDSIINGVTVNRRRPANPSPPLQTGRGNQEFFTLETGTEAVFSDTLKDEPVQNNPISRIIINPKGYPIPGNDNENVFLLELLNKDNKVLARQYIIYEQIDDEVDELLAVVIANIFAGIPPIKVKKTR